jgi:Spy/CpxP family protein refolding chaperone
MKHTILLSLAGIFGAAALAISQLGAADPTPASSPAPQESSSEKGPSPSGDSQKACGFDRFGHEGGKDRHGWGHWRGHGGEVEMLDRLLNLTDEQKEQVKEIIKAAKPKIKAIKEEGWTKIQAVKDEMRQQIRPLLTPAQQKVFDDAQKLRESARKLREDARKLRQETGEQS